MVSSIPPHNRGALFEEGASFRAGDRQIPSEPFDDVLDEGHPVRDLPDLVSLVLEQQQLAGHLAGPRRLEHLLGLVQGDVGVLGAVHDQQRGGQPVEGVQGRQGSQQVAVGDGVAVLADGRLVTHPHLFRS